MAQVDWKALNEVLQESHDIDAAWVFGSSQDGIVGAGRDLDIGILFTMKPTLDLLSELRASMQSALNIDNIDIVPLNEASPILRFEVICGRSLFYRNKSRFAEHVSLWAREYEDEMAMIEKSINLNKMNTSFD